MCFCDEGSYFKLCYLTELSCSHPSSSSVVCPRPAGGVLVLRQPRCLLAGGSGKNWAAQGSAGGSGRGSVEERHSTEHRDLRSAGQPAARDPVHRHRGNRGCWPAELRLQTGCHRYIFWDVLVIKSFNIESFPPNQKLNVSSYNNISKLHHQYWFLMFSHKIMMKSFLHRWALWHKHSCYCLLSQCLSALHLISLCSHSVS